MDQNANLSNNPQLLDNRFYTTKEVKIFESSDLRISANTVPAGTLLHYTRKVIRQKKRLGMIKENGRKLYFKYSGCTIDCQQCIVKEKGLDVLIATEEELSRMNIATKKGVFKDKDKELEKGEVHVQPGATILFLRDIDNDKDAVLTVAISDTSRQYELKSLQPGTKFYILSNPLFTKGKTIILMDGRKYILFNKEGVYKTVDDALTQATGVLAVIVGLTILIGGIVAIAASTGYIVVVGIVMIPVTIVLTVIIITPIMALLKFIQRLL